MSQNTYGCISLRYIRRLLLRYNHSEDELWFVTRLLKGQTLRHSFTREYETYRTQSRLGSVSAPLGKLQHAGVKREFCSLGIRPRDVQSHHQLFFCGLLAQLIMLERLRHYPENNLFSPLIWYSSGFSAVVRRDLSFSATKVQ